MSKRSRGEDLWLLNEFLSFYLKFYSKMIQKIIILNCLGWFRSDNSVLANASKNTSKYMSSETGIQITNKLKMLCFFI